MCDITIRKSIGCYALELNFGKETIILYFNSLQNAKRVKKIIELDKNNKMPLSAVEAAEMVAEAYYQDCKGS